MSSQVDSNRRCFLIAATGAVGVVGAAVVATPFVKYWNPSARAKSAGAPVEVDVSKLEYGAQLVVPWRGKPVWIVRRSDAVLATLKNEAMNDVLRDPHSDVLQQPDYAKNVYRSRNAEYLVLIGKCTHLGCAPKYRPEKGSVGANWSGGFYCPCHGSKFDLAGRVYKSVPAPTNLKVPPYVFIDDTRLIIGLDHLEQARS